MRLSLLSSLLFITLLFGYSHAGCAATALLQFGHGENIGHKHYAGVDIVIHASGTCVLSEVEVSVSLSSGASITAPINWDTFNGKITGLASLNPGSSYSEASFTYVGPITTTPSGSISVKTTTCKCTTTAPTHAPTQHATTVTITTVPTAKPTTAPTQHATPAPTTKPTTAPTTKPTTAPTLTATTAPTPPPTPAPTLPPHFSVGLRFLALACADADIRMGVITQVLHAVGSFYDVVLASTTTGPLSLTNADGSGKYSSIVTATELFCFTSDQQTQIAAYEVQFHVKLVTLYTFPYTSNGVTLASVGGTSVDGNATLNNPLSSFTRVVPANVVIPISGAWMYPSVVTDSTLATPAITITLQGQSSSYVLGSLITYPDGRRHLEFYVDQATWALYPLVLGNLWLEWVSNGFFAGMRRIQVNPHCDDVFMASGIWDINIHDESETDTYRLTPDDLNNLVQWQHTYNARLPAGSNVVLTFPFNGAPVVQDEGGYTNDALFKQAKVVRDNFYWESHTWSHPYLDNLTYSEVLAELTKNNATALTLFDNNLSNPMYCSKSMITPSITGLFNANALKAIHDVGIENIVGDNSRPELSPPDFYHGFYTNATVNGFAGIFVVPRHATNIYYDAQLPADEMSQYNYRYNSYWGRDLTFDEMIAEQVGEHIKLLLAYRQDPFMFHQANLGAFLYNGKNTTLVTYWAEKLADSLLQYSTLPLLSNKHDNLAQTFKDRIARDACGFTGTLQVDATTFAYAGITATSTASCKFALTGANAATSSLVSSETYGPEHTLWLEMSPSTPLNLVFSTPVAQI